MEKISIILLICVVLISAIEDLKEQRIPNIITFSAMAAALLNNALSAGLNGLVFSLGGLGTGFALFIIPYAMGGMGAGDVKLMMAVGAVLGPKGTLITSIMVILVGGLYGLVLFALHPRYASSFLRRSWMTLKTLALTFQLVLIPPDKAEKKPVLKYAVPIALGTFGYLAMQITGYDLFPALFGESFLMLSIAQGGLW